MKYFCSVFLAGASCRCHVVLNSESCALWMVLYCWMKGWSVRSWKLWVNPPSLPLFIVRRVLNICQNTVPQISATYPRQQQQPADVNLIVFVCLYPCTFKCSTRFISGANCNRKITTINRRGWKVQRTSIDAHIQEAITEHKHFSNIHIYVSLHFLWWGNTTSQKAIKYHLCVLSAILCPTWHLNFMYCYSNT